MHRLLIASLFAGLLIFADLPTRSPFPGQVRVRLAIRDEVGRATGVRLRVTDAKGIYWAPLGHLSQVDQSRRMSGDLILGDDETSPRRLHAYVYDGAEMDLPPGRYRIEARKGLEYAFVDQQVEIRANGQSVPVPLQRFANFERAGWYPGDTHMHFPDPAGVRFEMAAAQERIQGRREAGQRALSERGAFHRAPESGERRAAFHQGRRGVPARLAGAPYFSESAQHCVAGERGAVARERLEWLRLATDGARR
jgi:hypothetical protein